LDQKPLLAVNSKVYNVQSTMICTMPMSSKSDYIITHIITHCLFLQNNYKNNTANPCVKTRSSPVTERPCDASCHWIFC